MTERETNLLGDHLCWACDSACDCCQPDECVSCSRCGKVRPQRALHVATCETNGHVYGHAGVCVFCQSPKSSDPVEPTPTYSRSEFERDRMVEVFGASVANQTAVGKESFPDQPTPTREWRDIATCPKDRWILLWSQHWTDGGKPVNVPTLATWSQFSCCFVTHEGEVYKPTHWCDYAPVPSEPLTLKEPK